jgi:hypothetical protein
MTRDLMAEQLSEIVYEAHMLARDRCIVDLGGDRKLRRALERRELVAQNQRRKEAAQ